MIKLPKNEGLNIIPFIDIMLVLLAIVLSISTFIAKGEIEVNLPKSSSAVATKKQDDKLQIVINKNSKFLINGEIVNIEQINSQIKSIAPSTLVELKSDKDARFEAFIQLIDLLKLKEHENFKIITEKS